MFKITLDSPTLGKDETVTVSGVGELKNGETKEFDNSVAETFRMASASVRFNKKGDPELIKGQTLRQAFRKHPAIKVEYVKGEGKPDPVEDDETASTPEDENDGGMNA